MSDVPSNLIPTRITGLPEYLGTSTLGYLPYVFEGNTYKVQFANIAAVGAVPSTRSVSTGTGLSGGGDLSANRTLFISPSGVDDSRLTLTGVAAGTYGTASSVPVFTVNAQGRVTGVTATPIVLSNYVQTSRTVTAGSGLSGGGDLSANRTFAVNFSSTTPQALGPGSPGVSTVAAREDHVHPAVDLSDTTETQGVLPLSRGGTGNSLSPDVGAIAYSGGGGLYLTTAGGTGQVLTSAGGAGPPVWQTPLAGTVTSVNLTAGTGISVSGGPVTSAGSITVTNTAPDQIVSLTGTGSASVSGTYPNFTINSSGGTVTSASFTGGIVTVNTPTTTPEFVVAGTSGGIPYFSSGTTWATSAVLSANAIVVGGGAGVAPATVTTGTGVVTALGVNTGTAGAFVVNGGALGTPSGGTVTNLTGTASININGTVGATTPAAGTFTALNANGGASITLNPAITGFISLGTQITTGTIVIGNSVGTGTITLSHSSASQTTNIQSGITASGNTKTINLGANGAAGSTTNITIGGTAGTSTTTMNGNTVTPAGATTMTNGFFYIPSAAGAPTGVPTAIAGTVPMYYDTTNNRFYIYNGAWKMVTLV